ncbi:hypothetical protein [Glycomyces sp. NRRL B-16210]|uniref:hypothetical protein n=1 Tax=Glycomyces sp. NRRL B-16210 TaxID=1463821 RepID=UPI0004BEA8E1|nr:hypothetical protein [Glycomyces sp. NRRL B-16210]
MLELNPSLWDDIDLPMLQRIVDLYDRTGPFKAESLAQHFQIDLEPRDLAFSMKRLADQGYIESQNRAGGFPHSIMNVTEKARQTLVDRRGPESRAPRLEDLVPQLDDLTAKVAAALRAKPTHPDAPRWRRFHEVAVDLGSELSAKLAITWVERDPGGAHAKGLTGRGDPVGEAVTRSGGRAAAVGVRRGCCPRAS